MHTYSSRKPMQLAPEQCTMNSPYRNVLCFDSSIFVKKFKSRKISEEVDVKGGLRIPGAGDPKGSPTADDFSSPLLF